jgi:hypothetical protein
MKILEESKHASWICSPEIGLVIFLCCMLALVITSGILTFLSLSLQSGSVNEFSRPFFVVCWGWMSWQITRAGLHSDLLLSELKCWWCLLPLDAWIETLLVKLDGISRKQHPVACWYCANFFVWLCCLMREGMLLFFQSESTSSTCTGPVAFGLQFLWFWNSAILAQEFCTLIENSSMGYCSWHRWSVNWPTLKTSELDLAVLCQAEIIGW